MFAGRMKLKNFAVLAGVALGAIAVTGFLVLRGYSERTRDTGSIETAPVQAPSAGASEPTRTPGPEGRDEEIRRIVFELFGRNLGTDKLKDVTKGQSFKVNVYQDTGSDTANRAKVDLDRDDKWDEKWTSKDGVVSRQVAPNDDESYTETFVWNGSSWARE